jgi:hypothetical protein
LAGWIARLLGQLPDCLFVAEDTFAREQGWEITTTTGRFGIGARSYRDPRFSQRAAAARTGPEGTQGRAGEL